MKFFGAQKAAKFLNFVFRWNLDFLSECFIFFFSQPKQEQEIFSPSEIILLVLGPGKKINGSISDFKRKNAPFHVQTCKNRWGAPPPQPPVGPSLSVTNPEAIDPRKSRAEKLIFLRFRHFGSIPGFLHLSNP